MKSLSFAGLVALCLTLCACASVPEVHYDRQAATDIKTIGLVTPYTAEGASFILASSVGQGFGLVGALIDVSIRQDREKQFNGVLTAHHYVARDVFVERVTQGLQAEGYAVTPVAAVRDKPGFLASYPTAQVDAYLDVVFAPYGYLSGGFLGQSDWRPNCGVTVRLVRASDSKLLMQDTMVVNFNDRVFPSKNVVQLPPNPHYHWSEFKDLIAQADEAMTGLDDVVGQCAAATTGLLK